MSEQLDEALAAARKWMRTASIEEKAEMTKAQRESWVRAFTTPCEHGQLDFEQCGECRGAGQ